MDTRDTSLRNSAIALSTLLVATLGPVGGAGAQARNPFGLQDRADAASQMIVLGVQQGISSLPPTSGQAFTYDYNAGARHVRRERAARPDGAALRRRPSAPGGSACASRPRTSSSARPSIRSSTTSPVRPFRPMTVTAFGMSASANVVLFNVAATYGFTDRIEATINIPFSVVDAEGFNTFLTGPPPFPPPMSPLTRVRAVPGDGQTIQNSRERRRVGVPHHQLQRARRRLQQRQARRPGAHQRRRQGAAVRQQMGRPGVLDRVLLQQPERGRVRRLEQSVDPAPLHRPDPRRQASELLHRPRLRVRLQRPGIEPLRLERRLLHSDRQRHLRHRGGRVGVRRVHPLDAGAGDGPGSPGRPTSSSPPRTPARRSWGRTSSTSSSASRSGSSRGWC